MRELERIDREMIQVERVLHFPLALLRQGPVLPLKPDGELRNPVAVPSDAEWPWMLLDNIRRTFGQETETILVAKGEIEAALNSTFDMASASAADMLDGLAGEAELQREFEQTGDLLDADDEAPVIRLVNSLIGQALKERASDIHIEPFQKDVLVRFRVDGVLHTVVRPPKNLQKAMTSRIKVMSDMDVAEKRQPQDGRFRVRVAGREVDVRVSVLPTAFGERVVMRLLERSHQVLGLRELGMGEEQLLQMQSALAAPHGIVLVTGPTGSGKSTTLYAGLLEVNRDHRNVLTIEDPVEYQLDGIGQMQVQPKIGVTFASGLRSILRQDPDIIMVGEIRDLETAEIAIQSSLTGHLVLSTLHTNDALSAILRLQDMGIEPYLVASSLVVVQAQRLVRELCPYCKRAREVRAADWQALGVAEKEFAGVSEIYEAAGCDHCMQTGYLGRLGIFELLQITDEMREAIHDGKGLHALKQLARKAGMQNLRQNGAYHVTAGKTSIDEVLRVTREDAGMIQE